ncbi:HAD family hydrolase [Streptomyces sp. NPDC058657]|uniref:HAD family hydrolase n=1 Tax=unclassified Streptomyces TaxID=2593676 RepID=UPI0036525C70
MSTHARHTQPAAGLTDPTGPSGPAGAAAGPVVGFDLDMTLIDSRPGIKAAYQRLTAETGVPIDADLVVSRLGPPLEQEIANWFPAERVEEIANRYRALYPACAITPATALPGAREAVAAVREAGGRVVVVTGKWQPNAVLHLEHLGFEVDAVIGNVWAEGKALALREHGATVYVGDHLGDVRGARAADALAVAVTTGPYGAQALREAGADVVMADLTEFPEWLENHRTAAA